MKETPPFDRQVLPVRELTGRIRRLLEQQIGRVWVEGECSNVGEPASGHCYFTLKDEQSQLQCVWFRGRRAPDAVRPKDGMHLRVYGLISAYERGGGIQIIVEQVEDAGVGDLQKAFEALKAKLKQEGLFDAHRKKPLPLLPRCIGIATSPTGAAIRDMLNVLGRRYPDRHLLLAPVKAQGTGSAEGIARAIEYFNETGSVDVIIIGRGGGSLEDLWSFNEERVARAIAASNLPVISAVGHETDFTISDFVADLRAPTPSAAAELVIGHKEDFAAAVERLSNRMAAALTHETSSARHRLARMANSYVFTQPQHLLSRHRQKIEMQRNRLRDLLRNRIEAPRRRLDASPLLLHHALRSRLDDAARRIDEHGADLDRAMTQRQERDAHRIERLQQALTLLNPYAVLDRGFSITRDADGHVISDVSTLTIGDKLETLNRSGTISSTIDSLEPKELS